mmetsp:Transcript_16144/g.38288  ORF Transcript_16144/g.38288 Transcript_16144/m.38288 type:complete len:344 (-) Transcript_16144:546-1577(-)
MRGALQGAAHTGAAPGLALGPPSAPAATVDLRPRGEGEPDRQAAAGPPQGPPGKPQDRLNGAPLETQPRVQGCPDTERRVANDCVEGLPSPCGLEGVRLQTVGAVPHSGRGRGGGRSHLEVAAVGVGAHAGAGSELPGGAEEGAAAAEWVEHGAPAAHPCEVGGEEGLRPAEPGGVGRAVVARQRPPVRDNHAHQRAGELLASREGNRGNHRLARPRRAAQAPLLAGAPDPCEHVLAGLCLLERPPGPLVGSHWQNQEPAVGKAQASRTWTWLQAIECRLKRFALRPHLHYAPQENATPRDFQRHLLICQVQPTNLRFAVFQHNSVQICERSSADRGGIAARN